jgi:hypothetical protein
MSTKDFMVQKFILKLPTYFSQANDNRTDKNRYLSIVFDFFFHLLKLD